MRQSMRDYMAGRITAAEYFAAHETATVVSPDPCLVSLDYRPALPFRVAEKRERAWREARQCPLGCGVACRRLDV